MTTEAAMKPESWWGGGDDGECLSREVVIISGPGIRGSIHSRRGCG